MKKSDQDKNLFNSDVDSNKNFETDKIKTTNVNILLNRVRLDRRRTLKKKVLLSIFLITIVSFLSAYFIY